MVSADVIATRWAAHDMHHLRRHTMYTTQAHVKLGKQTILCRVRKATPRDLKLHMM